jgi:DNA-binding transcriptional MocR family regulator
MARPRIEIDQKEFEAFCRMNPTLKDCAAFFKVSEDTIERRCKEWDYEGFADSRQQNMVHTRLRLIRTALKQAENGNTAMLIFCLKNLCGWTDKNETKETSSIEIKIDKDDADL